MHRQREKISLALNPPEPANRICQIRYGAAACHLGVRLLRHVKQWQCRIFALGRFEITEEPI
jgi:hypothetical protein